MGRDGLVVEASFPQDPVQHPVDDSSGEGTASDAAHEEMAAVGLGPAGQVLSDRLSDEGSQRDDSLLRALAADQQLTIVQVEVLQGDHVLMEFVGDGGQRNREDINIVLPNKEEQPI